MFKCFASVPRICNMFPLILCITYSCLCPTFLLPTFLSCCSFADCHVCQPVYMSISMLSASLPARLLAEPKCSPFRAGRSRYFANVLLSMPCLFVPFLSCIFYAMNQLRCKPLSIFFCNEYSLKKVIIREIKNAILQKKHIK